MSKDDIKPCPFCGDREFRIARDYRAQKPHPTTIPWRIAELAYSTYVRKYASKQTLERINERGGFYAEEMDELMPGWRDMVSEAADLRCLARSLWDARRNMAYGPNQTEMMLKRYPWLAGEEEKC